jgi:hypothetical protein
MLGMKESLNNLLEYLKLLIIPVYFAFELLQIKHTCRYLLFWSFEHEIPKDSNDHIKITAKTRRTQTIKIENNAEEYIKDIINRYGDENLTDFTLLITHNKWSRKYRRSPLTVSPPPLESPMKISIQKSGNELIFSVDAETDWETFLSFINHLRK